MVSIAVEPTTFEKYWVNGEPNEERRDLINGIIDQHVAGKTAAEKPSFLVIGGGVLTGKASLKRLLLDRGIINNGSTILVEPSYIIKAIPEFFAKKDALHPEKWPEHVDEFYAVVKAIANKAIAKGLSVVFVDHANYLDPIKTMADEAKKAGYETALVGMTISPELCQQRRDYRISKLGETMVDKDTAVAYLQRFSNLWDSFIPCFDTSVLIHDDGDTPKIAATFTRDATTIREEIMNEEKYGQFKELGKPEPGRGLIGESIKSAADFATGMGGGTGSSAPGERYSEQSIIQQTLALLRNEGDGHRGLIELKEDMTKRLEKKR